MCHINLPMGHYTGGCVLRTQYTAMNFEPNTEFDVRKVRWD